ncbi:MAG: large conductance mechanosensitive channel protein MscL [Lachnospiraceae bacterium]|nr:large conductance mechanosensitive channel protein MscL [Lachnospiraceae bacterium]
MKKFMKEFKEFALKGNVMNLAIGVIIGAAFQSLITSFTECFINPIINSIGGAEVAGHFEIFSTGQYIEYGAFITAVINFFIMAFVIFMMMKGMNALSNLGKKKEEAAPLTRKCPYCYGEIDIKATKCMHCTSDIEPEA